MYGTVARMQVKPGMLEQLTRAAEDQAREIRGMIFEYTFQMDDDPNVCYLAVGFESKDAYVANAESPEQNARYQQYRQYLSTEPEWHDGQIIQTMKPMG